MEQARGLGESQSKPRKSFVKRVLNADFAHPNNQLLDRDTALFSNNFYKLLVDVGPVWEKAQSLVVVDEKAFFPEEKLPQKRLGYQVRVIFVSEDFSPKLSTAEIWIPARQGQSYPLIDGKRSDIPGPVALRMRAPQLKASESRGRAYGRLCLYYKGQLIQSALVSVGVTQSQSDKLEDSVRYHAWIWILSHPKESRPLLDSLSEKDQRYYRHLTDDEYWHMLTRQALQYYKSEKRINEFVRNNKLWNYPDAYSLLETRYPRTYKQYLGEIQA